MQDNSIIDHISDVTEAVELQSKALHEQLARYINNLIVNNFDGLIFILYRLDVSEQKLKMLLAENKKEDAAGIIATLIIERQLQKIKSRKEHKRDFDTNDMDEKW